MNPTRTAAAWALEIPQPRQRMKILLVDDNPDNLFSVQTALEPLQEEIYQAGSGKEALRLCLEHDFAAILLDVRMPEMDGFETAEYIRSRERSKNTPLLFLTAYRSDEQLFRGYDLGAVDFLFRPVVPEVLQSKVRVFVELSRTTQLLREQAATMARAERKFRSLLEGAPDAMVITYDNGEIVLVNSRAESVFEKPRKQLLGRDIAELVPDWHAVPASATLEAADDARRFPSIRMQAVRAGGIGFPVEIALSPLVTEEGVLITSAIRDVTEKVRNEERIQRINTELERRVTERTAELTHSNEALRQFAWAASHDLQEPLRMVISFSQLLGENSRLHPEDADLLRIITENGLRLENLVSALRQYLQISESGAAPRQIVDCERAFESAVQNLTGIIQQAEAVVSHDPLPSIPAVEVLLLQLFQNLISNAVKYRSQAPPRIHVSAESAGGRWVFSVKDNGVGVAPEYRDYIFGVFKRLNPGRHPGTGIGLAICKSAAERLGGEIWVESEPGSGSTFKFTVPVENA